MKSNLGDAIRFDQQQIKTMAIVAVAIILSFALYLATLFVAGASFGAAPVGDPAPARTAPAAPCETVSPQRFNRRLKVLDALTNYRHRKVSRRQCKTRYRELGAQVRKARRDCMKKVRITGASYYGYGDSGGIVGSCGVHLLTARARNSFAILQSGNVASRCGQRFYFHRGGRTASGIQLDTGGGGGPAGGYARTFDFWNPPAGGGLARAMGLTSTGLGAVQYSLRNCWIK